jgi:hypothetical protein
MLWNLAQAYLCLATVSRGESQPDELEEWQRRATALLKIIEQRESWQEFPLYNGNLKKLFPTDWGARTCNLEHVTENRPDPAYSPIR